MDEGSHAAPFILSCAYFTYEKIEFRRFHLAVSRIACGWAILVKSLSVIHILLSCYLHLIVRIANFQFVIDTIIADTYILLRNRYSNNSGKFSCCSNRHSFNKLWLAAAVKFFFPQELTLHACVIYISLPSLV